MDDEELVSELRRYGEAVPKITDKNRDIYIKKLNHYKARQKLEENPSKQSKSLLLNKTKSQQTKKQTNGHYNDDNESNNDDVNDVIVDYDNNNHDHNNGDFKPLEIKSISKITTNNRRSQIMADNSRSNDTTSEYVQVSNANTSPLSNSVFNYTTRSTTRASRSTTNNIQNDDNDCILLDTNNVDSDRGTIGSSISSDIQYKRLKDKIELDKTLQKYRSEIHDILDSAKVRSRVVPSTQNQSNGGGRGSPLSSIYQSSNDINSQKSSLFNSNRYKNIFGNNNNNNNNNAESTFKYKLNKCLKSLKRKSIDWGLKISKLLPYIVFIIFLIIFLQYTRMKMSANNITLSSLFTNKNAYVREMYCADITDTKCAETKNLVRHLIDHLRSKTGTVECKYGTIKDSKHLVSYDDVINFFHNQGLISKTDEPLRAAMDSVIEAIVKSPDWKIKLYNDSRMETSNLKDVKYFGSDIALKGFTCRFVELMQTLSINIIIAGLLLFVGFLTYLIIVTYYKKQQQKQKSFYELVSQVVSLVERQYELSLNNENIKPYLAIQHVFDTLIEPSQRALQKATWNQVVKFINENESRVRMETQTINGEETLVWKWMVPANLLNSSHVASLSPKSSSSSSSSSSSLLQSPKQPSLYPSLEQFKDQQQSSSTSRLASSASSTTTTTTNNSLLSSKLLTTSTPTNQSDDDEIHVNVGAYNDQSQQQQQQQSQNNCWQGDAFNKNPDRMFVSPTPCLKIRNMFDQSIIDTEPMFYKRIQNDILNKCAHVNSIIHITCDKKSKEGCVYLRCNTNDAAGKVYQALNGTWYNGKLLNVKFLRSDRYLERFPDSVNYILPLKPAIY